nr:MULTISPECIES: type III pantothenate kinase [unclassified Polynucleobacter]
MLLFDLGNTRLKWAAVEQDSLPSERNKKVWAFSGTIDTKLLLSPEHGQELAQYILQTVPQPTAIAICSVASSQAKNNLQNLLTAWSSTPWINLQGDSPFTGLRTQYAKPLSLGADRWAALIGARTLFGGNALVVSAGTASTIDLLGSNGIHYGGWILPGFTLMANSLVDGTAQLQAPKELSASREFGLSSAAAIQNGCMAAQVGALHEAITLAAELHHPIEHIFIDGGNAGLLVEAIHSHPTLKNRPLEVVDRLALRGLWAYLQQNT